MQSYHQIWAWKIKILTLVPYEKKQKYIINTGVIVWKKLLYWISIETKSTAMLWRDPGNVSDKPCLWRSITGSAEPTLPTHKQLFRYNNVSVDFFFVYLKECQPGKLW